ncbi:MAG: helix-turn-helix transcriptional regulator, partial [Nitrospirales bacterium]|nr:helix-turn-helix transcriptional regulator [Nitrospirales bacterium]
NITNDYALAKKLKVSQPEANWFRRGKKTPNPTVCIRMANLLEKNPVELLIVAQKDRAAPEEKSHWAMALTAVDVMVNVPQRPRYIPQKVKAIGQELRQLETQMITYEGTIAQNEAGHLLSTVQTSVDSIMERWQVWKRDGPLFPNYLLANQAAVKRGVKIRRVFILNQSQLKDDGQIEEFIQVLNDQKRAGISVYFALREEIGATLIFQRFFSEFKKLGVTGEINGAIFDNELLIFSRSYIERPLGITGIPIPITSIEQLHISWNEDHLREVNPSPLFETRFVYEYKGERSFHTQLNRFKRSRARNKR